MKNTPSMNALKDRFSRTESTGGQNNYYPFYKMPDDAQARIRFLPDTNDENSLGFLIEKLSHSLKINGENKTVACLAQYGEDCPICKVAKEYYDAEDKVNGKLYYKKRNYVAQALIVEDPIVDPKHENAAGKVKLIQIGYSLFKIIKDAFESGELDVAPFAFDGGTDFLIKKTKQGEFASYTLSKFARKSSTLTEDEVAVAERDSVDLSTLLPKKPDIKLVNNLLQAALTGKRLNDEDDEDDEDNSAFEMLANKNRTAATKKVEDEDDEDETPAKVATKPAATVVENDDEDAEAAALLAQLQATRAARAAKRAESE